MFSLLTLQMASYMLRLGARLRGEHGASAVEYGVMLAAIIAVIAGTVFLVGDEVFRHFNDFNTNFPP